MIRTCPHCGYSTDHPKHIRACTEAWRYTNAPMPSVSVKVVDQNGIRDVPILPQAAATIAPVAPTSLRMGDEETGPVSEEGYVSLSSAPASVTSGACCKHPEQMHVADAEGFPPTCMGCPEGADEHEWQPANGVHHTVWNIGTADESRTINSPMNRMCECGFLAKTAGSLNVHRAKARIHQVTSA